MDQKLALEIMLGGEHVLLTGAAGSGKTYVLNDFIKRAKLDGKHVSVTATTGLAATHLGGNTIHSWSGMGVRDELPENFADYLPKGRREIIEKTDVLVIDEISMMHDFRLDMVDKTARVVRENDQPFGGIQVVLCGDFFQLPPINRSDSKQGGFVVGSEVWEQLNPVVCYLGEQYRQDDQDFLRILNSMRAGDVRRGHAETLLARTDSDPEGEVTELHTKNVDVDRINDARLAQVEGESHTYYMDTTGSDNYVETLKRSCLAVEELTLKVGAFVMFIKNAADRKYANGTLGVVKEFEQVTNYPVIELKSGKTVVAMPDVWELRDGDKKRASLTQIPLRLAWAITVHKSQGMTLDAAKIDLSKAFVEGMGYVALSRVRNLNGLHLIGINRMALKISPEALRIDEELRANSEAAAQKYAHLKNKAKERDELEKVQKSKKQPSGDWNEKLANMRKTYPNAFKPWSESDDATLQELFVMGNPVADICQSLGRHPGSIRARLRKLYGEDIAPV